jgi:hypothetical protein
MIWLLCKRRGIKNIYTDKRGAARDGRSFLCALVAAPLSIIRPLLVVGACLIFV